MTQQTTQRTAGYFVTRHGNTSFSVCHANGSIVVVGVSDKAADFIVSKLNAHDDLVAALREMVDYAESPDFDGAPSDATVQKARAALSKAGAAP